MTLLKVFPDVKTAVIFFQTYFTLYRLTHKLCSITIVGKSEKEYKKKIIDCCKMNVATVQPPIGD